LLVLAQSKVIACLLASDFPAENPRPQTRNFSYTNTLQNIKDWIRMSRDNNTKNPLENGTFIKYEDFKVKDENRKIKDEYKLIFERAKTLLESFIKTNPNIVATYEFDEINKVFWLWDKHGRQKEEENICRDFLNLLNSQE
jgi:ABC-type tungstate transport system permease subunit